MFLKLLCIFTIIPLIELYILIKIGSHFGVLNTIIIVIGTGALGAYLARQEGFKVWVMIQHELNQGRFPADELIEGLILLNRWTARRPSGWTTAMPTPATMTKTHTHITGVPL